MTVFGCVRGVKRVEVGIHLFLSLGDADNLEAPDIAEFGAFVVGTVLTCADAQKAARVVVIVVDSNLIVGKVCADAVGEVLDAVAPADSDFPAFGGHGHTVYVRHRGSENVGQVRTGSHHVESLALIVVKAAGKAVVEQTPVETYVPCLVLFPCERACHERRLGGISRFFTADEPAIAIGAIAHVGVCGIPVVGVLVAQTTP